MKKLYVSLLLLMSGVFLHAQTASVQVIHNSGDPAANVVDIYLDGELALDDVGYRTATEFLDLPAGAEIVIGVAPGDSESAEDILAEFPVTLTEGESYVVMATGVLDPSSFDTNANSDIAFTLEILTPAQTASDDAANVSFAAYHGATDAPGVDVVVSGGDVLVDDLAYGAFSDGYLTVPAAAYTLDITLADNNSAVVETYDVDLSGLGGGAAVVFASGFLNPLNNQGGAGFGLFAALPDGTVVEFPVAEEEAGTVTVSDNIGEGTTTWTSNNTYILDGFVFVNEGDTLIIEPGTVIKGETGQGAQASALIVARGGYIIAEGTAAEPIIFTSVLDDVDNPDDIPAGTSGLWGGVIILGNATLNSTPGETAIEGIPTTEPRGLYGGDDDEDDSGIFRYASIRHGGTDIGAGNEINGLTMGGVGSATTIEYVEVIFNADDGFEWFGGTVNTKWLVSAFNADDAMDYDEGFRGKGQYWFVIQSDAVGSDRGGEHDGGTEPETAEPFATPEIFNATYIGRGEPANARTITFRDNAGGSYKNSIFTEYGRGIDVEKLESGTHSFDRLQAGDLSLMNNVFWNVAGNDSSAIFTVAGGNDDDQAFIQNYFGEQGNSVANPGLLGISRETDGSLDPRPTDISGYANLAEADDDFFDNTNFKGAFGPQGIWAKGWTYMDFLGYFVDAPQPISVPVENAAFVQIIHNSGDPAANVVDIYVDGELALDNVGYRTATPFIQLPGEVEITIGVAGEESESADDIIAEFPVTLTEGESYVVMATGVLNPDDFDTSANAEIGFNLEILTPASTEADEEANVTFAAYHGATDAPAVDVVAGGTVLVDDLAYGSFSDGYLTVPADAYTLDITLADDNAAIVESYDVDLSGLGGGAAVVFASGFLNPLDNQGGAGFALLAALPDGTVVEFPVAEQAVGTVTVTDNTGEGTTIWTSDNEYILDGFVFVNEGDTLIIEPGTVIKGETGQGAQASALIVARGGYIIAEGTAAEPIIFTSILDDVDDPSDIPAGTSGLWGGVIILGNATLNSTPGETAIEGIPTTEPRGLYGGDDDEDNSGIFRYASIRHGGTDIGAGNEINGLTMGGVGSGTTIDHVEVIFNADDGFEWFGGTVNTSYLVSAFNADDAMDYDEGFRGKGQFWFVIQSDAVGSDRGGEHDGGTEPETAEPFATPEIFNATYIGRGEPANARTITFRDNAGGSYKNSIFTEYGRGIDVEKLESGTHSFDRLQAGDLSLMNNVFWNVAGNDPAAVFTVAGGSDDDQTFIQNYFGEQANEVSNPALVGVSRETDGGLDPRPSDAVAYGNLAAAEDDFFMATNYKGAFGPQGIWAKGWTYMDFLGYFAEAAEPVEIVVEDSALVQVIHNSGDPAANVVDVYVNGALAIDNFAYRTATPFIPLPAGVALTLGVAPEDSEGPQDIIAEFPTQLDSGVAYVVVATGVLNPDEFDTSANEDIGFNLAVFPNALTEGTAGNVSVLAYHGATDAPTVDINIAELGAPAFTDLSYGGFQGYGDLPTPAAPITLEVALDSDGTVVASFTADLTGLDGQTGVVFASGFVNPLNNQGGAGFALLAALPDGTVIELPEVVVEPQTIVVADNTGEGTTTWESQNTYILDRFVFVNEGDTLIIEPGTVIKGRTGQGAQASALIVARGGYIIAEGTAAEPIIFTSVLDDVNNPDDIPVGTSGLWGGVIILGNATLNSTPGETAIEGIPTTEPRGLYGGDDDEDNSGIFRYASIRHGGTDIGAGNEINGLTMGGVGSGTTIDHVEVIFNADDGFEWFGGTVNTSYLVSAFNADDAMDYDEGFRGKGQFWFVIQSDAVGSDRGGEHDGGTEPETAEPFATPEIFNATYIGRGEPANARTITFRDNAGGSYKNSIFTEYGRGIDVEKLESGTHSFDRLQAGDLSLMNNIFWNVAGNDPAAVFSVAGGSDEDQTFIQGYFGDNGNEVANPAIVGVSREPNGGLDPRFSDAVALNNLAELPEDTFFMAVDYKGAFGLDDIWAKGWTYLDFLGYFVENVDSIEVSVVPGFQPVEGLSIYPNPSNGVFTVRAESLNAQKVSIDVFDMIGNRVHFSEVRPVAGAMNERVDLTNLAPAVYLMRVTQGDKMAVQRIIVE